MKHCKRCGHRWLPRVAKPACCPVCKSRVYEKQLANRKRKVGEKDEDKQLHNTGSLGDDPIGPLDQEQAQWEHEIEEEHKEFYE